MSKLTVVQRLFIILGLPLVVMIGLVVLSLSLFSSINNGIERIYDQRVTPMVQLQKVNDAYSNTILNAINKADNGLLLPNEALAAIKEAKQIIDESWALYRTNKLNAEEERMAQEVEALSSDTNEALKEVMDVLASMGNELIFDEDGETPVADYNGDLYESIDPLSNIIGRMIQYQLKVAGQERGAAATIYENSKTSFAIGSIITVVLLVLAGITVARSIARPLARLRAAMEEAERNQDLTVTVEYNERDEIGQVALAYMRMMNRFDSIMLNIRDNSVTLTENAGSLADTTLETRQDIGVQTRETDLVATASTEMCHAIEEVSNHAQRASESANEANEQTSHGARVLSTTIESVNRLSERMQGASDVINRVENDSTAIGSVLDVIRGIAEQTNLLALNAAIEAARAGEQGRGFAVVADEVRTLAQRTQESTEEIQQMIQRLQSGTREAVLSMDAGSKEMQSTLEEAAKAGDALNAISQAVDEISSMNAQIAISTQEQMSVSQEIAKNVVSISDICKRSENSVQQVEKSSRVVEDVALALKNLVGEFKL